MRLERLNWSLVLGLVLIGAAVACGPDEDEAPAADATGDAGAARDDAPPSSADEPEALVPGVIRGVVRSARTGDPLEGALLSAGDFGATSDASGGYELPPLPPGPVIIRAYLRGFDPGAVEVVVNSGELTVADVALDASAPACCELEGDWSGQFTLDSAGLNSRPSARSLEGALSFEADGEDGAVAGADDRVARSSGVADLDFGPLLGSDMGAVGGLEGMAFSGDSVAITLFPRFGDWAIELRGLQSEDSIRGRWFQRASCCGAYGSFVLTREASPGAGRGSG